MKSIILRGHEVRRALEHGTVRIVRPVMPQPPEGTKELGMSDCREFYRDFPAETRDWRCPLGAPGEVRWVREKFYIEQGDDFDAMCLYAATDQKPDAAHWRSSAQMPRLAARPHFTLKLLGVRVPRVTIITEEEARAAGMYRHDQTRHSPHSITDGKFGLCNATAVECFRWLWDRLYAKRGRAWADNPLVWSGGFEVVK